MAIQGVKGNILELLLSTDKSVQDFIASLKPGDALRGRIVDIIPADNKAVINFKGFNLISQLPQDSALQKGDMINVTVSQLDNRVFMKISAEALGRAIEMPQESMNVMTPQQIIQTLNALNIPVNEQNIYIAQKLADYHLPVTKQNVADVNAEVNNYLQNRGIDPKVFNVDGLTAAKDLVFSNFFKLGSELQKAADSLRNMAQVMENRGQQVLTRNDFLASRNDAAIKALNMFSVLNYAASATGGAASLNYDESGVTLTMSKPDSAVMNEVLNAAVNEGAITTSQAQTALNALSQEKASFRLSRDIFVVKDAEKTAFKYSGAAQNLETITAGPAGPEVNALKDALLDNAFAQKNIAQVTAQSAISSDMNRILTIDAKALVVQAGEIFSALKSNIFTPQNTSLNENVKETVSLIRSLQANLTAMSAALDEINVKPSGPERAAVAGFKYSVNFSLDASKTVIKELGAGAAAAEITVKPNEYGAYQAAIKDFITRISDTEIFKSTAGAPAAAGKQGVNEKTAASPIAVNLPVDVESTIEASIFLKSRNLPADSKNLIDIMSRYFKDDMKLNRSLETLGSSLGRLETAFKGTANRMELKGILDNITSVKNVISDISIKTNDSSLKAGILEGQLRNFIDKSGLNLENKLLNRVITDANAVSKQASNAVSTQAANAVVESQIEQITQYTNQSADSAVKPAFNAAKNTPDMAPVFPQAGGDNLKSRVLELLNNLNITDDSRVSAVQKHAVRQAREAATDLLTNLNALSLMNQKPVSFDMAYTQIPVIFNNKLFNGELQVWYRKGALKEDLKKTNVPVNMVFMLNTSNLGPVKVSMTVYKNEVECTVKAGSEKAKQALMRYRNDFLGSLQGLDYNVKNFNVMLEGGAEHAPSSGEGYINIGRINLQA